MRSSVPTWIEKLIERDDGAPLEIHVYRLVCLLASFVSIGLVIPANLFQHVSGWVTVIAGLMGLTTLGMYRASRRGTNMPKTLLVVVVMALNGIWFLNGGMSGSVGLYFPGAALLAVLFVPGRWRMVAVALVVADALGLLLVERWVPGCVIPFATERDRVIDLATGLPISVSSCTPLMRIVLAGYHGEHRRLEQANEELEKHLAEIRTLRGLLPICAWCRRVRDDQGLWTRVEQYLGEHTGARLTHGVCPDCEQRHFPAEEGTPGAE